MLNRPPALSSPHTMHCPTISLFASITAVDSLFPFSAFKAVFYVKYTASLDRCRALFRSMALVTERCLPATSVHVDVTSRVFVNQTCKPLCICKQPHNTNVVPLMRFLIYVLCISNNKQRSYNSLSSN